ncbi:hypothetical protein SAY86_028926 [Trapa natans]|uniref:DUF4408 domain-containing protein n=1 Tax=Trapa natans TaxID=22666 RepID=A0AAN7MG72_TRANT|nr:hypothetical protein SAY86_028926 [Trapa natans]
MLLNSLSSVPSIWATVNSWFTPTVLFVFLNLMIAVIVFSSSFSKPSYHEQENPEQVHEIHRNLERSPSVLQRLKSFSFYPHRSSPTVTHYTAHSYGSAPLQEKEHDNGNEEKIESSFARSSSNVLHTVATPDTTVPSTSTTDINNLFQKPQERGVRLSFGEVLEEEEAGEEELVAADGREEQEEVEEFEEPNRSEEQSTLDEIYSQLKDNRVGKSKSHTKPASGEVPIKLSKKIKKSASAKSAFAHFEEDDIVEKLLPVTTREYKTKVSDEEEEGEGEVDAKADDFINRFKQQLRLQRLESIARYKDMVNRRNNG